MPGGAIHRNAARLIRLHGETMILSREGEATTIGLQGKRIPGGTDDVGGSAEQQRFRVKIAPTEMLASAWTSKVPSSGTDTLTVGGRARTVVDWKPMGDGDTVALYELEVVG
ncbi:hypothetical protein [Reyranella sp.]|uniref:hypothetical protein n=1 Tax=Reyranella sp. TaxID=1929291 RepID=UPI00271D75A2|nr:hypothetical protein [Reyranella sp.]MDO8974335.1 hypothetical protein [Reyranella sp.]